MSLEFALGDRVYIVSYDTEIYNKTQCAVCGEMHYCRRSEWVVRGPFTVVEVRAKIGSWDGMRSLEYAVCRGDASNVVLDRPSSQVFGTEIEASEACLKLNAIKET